MEKVVLKIPDKEYKLMMRTIKALQLDSKRAELVYQMCTSLFTSGANEATQFIKKQIEERFKEKTKN